MSTPRQIQFFQLVSSRGRAGRHTVIRRIRCRGFVVTTKPGPHRKTQPVAHPLVCQSLGVCVESPLHMQPLMPCTRLRKGDVRGTRRHRHPPAASTHQWTQKDRWSLRQNLQSKDECRPPALVLCARRNLLRIRVPHASATEQRQAALVGCSTAEAVQSHQRTFCTKHLESCATQVATAAPLSTDRFGHFYTQLSSQQTVVANITKYPQIITVNTDPPVVGSAERPRQPQRRKAETTETAVSFLTHWQRWKIEQNTKQPPYTTNKLTKLLSALVIPTTLNSRTAYGPACKPSNTNELVVKLAKHGRTIFSMSLFSTYLHHKQKITFSNTGSCGTIALFHATLFTHNKSNSPFVST